MAEQVADRLDKRHDDVAQGLRNEWAALMKHPPSEERSEATNMLLDRANAIGIGRLDRP